LLSCKSQTGKGQELDIKEPAFPHVTENQDTLGQKKPFDLSTTFKYHWTKSNGLPLVAIVVDDFGNINGDLLNGFMSLDKDISFAVLPDLPQTRKTVSLAVGMGHEVILHVPMEAIDKNQNPGLRFIKTGMTETEIQDLLNKFLDQVPQAMGINNHMGSGVTSNENAMSSIMAVLKRRGMFFLDSRTTPATKSAQEAYKYQVPYASRDIFLDVPDVSALTLNQKLKDVVKYKGRLEPVIIITHCHNKTKLDAVRTFISQLKGIGIQLIPLSVAVEKFNSPI
jgi:polysaccharide deacetylase 2 family uncharacterized protein YibQ